MKRTHGITEFGKICRKIRLKEDMEQKEMAAILKLTPSTLCGYELGKTKIPYRLGVAIANSFNLTKAEKLTLEKTIEEHNLNFTKATAEKKAETYKKKQLEKQKYEEYLKGEETTEYRMQMAIIELLNNQLIELGKINAQLGLLLDKKKRKRWFK